MKNSIKHSLFTAVFMVLLLTACSNSFWQASADCSLSIGPALSEKIIEAANSRKIYANTVEASSSLSVTVELSGGYSSSQTKQAAVSTLKDLSFTFSGIPVNSVVDLYVSVSYEGFLLYEGSQSGIAIKKGSNSLSLALLRLLNTPIVLYNYDDATFSYQYHLVDYAGATVSGTGDFTSKTNSFAFDADGNFYALSNEDNSAKILTANHDEISIEDGGSITGIAIDLNTNTLYAYSKNEMTLELYQYPHLISSGSTEEKLQYTVNYTAPDSFFHDLLVIYDGVLYEVGEKDSEKLLLSVALPGSSATVDTPDAQVNLSEKTLSGMELSDEAAVTDMLYQDGAVYILVRDYKDNLTASGDINNQQYYSRGALLKYDVKSQSLIPPLGWTSDAIPADGTGLYGYYNNNDSTKVHFLKTNASSPSESGWFVLSAERLKALSLPVYPSLYAPSSSSASAAFYGPQKFIAIKPKKLVIADDGLAFYTDSNGAFRARNANRVVTVDLEKFAIAASQDVSAAFEADESDDIFPASNYTKTGDYLQSGETIYLSGGSSFTNTSGNETNIYAGIPLED